MVWKDSTFRNLSGTSLYLPITVSSNHPSTISRDANDAPCFQWVNLSLNDNYNTLKKSFAALFFLAIRSISFKSSAMDPSPAHLLMEFFLPSLHLLQKDKYLMVLGSNTINPIPSKRVLLLFNLPLPSKAGDSLSRFAQRFGQTSQSDR